jgi:hypothetical protein
MASGTSLAASLYNVFPDSNVAAHNEIAFMDGYIAEPSGREDVDLTLRYCTALAQLANYFEQRKASFPKLCRAMQFSLRIGDTNYTTSCHLMELLLSTMGLGALVCVPVMNALPLRQSGGSSADTGPVPLILTRDLETSVSELKLRHAMVRKVIGLFNYCIQHVLPRASYVARLLNEHHPGFTDGMKSSYHTLRALGCWLAAAVLFRASSSESPDEVQYRCGVKHLRECVMIVDATRASGLPVLRMAQTLRVSAQYEGDIRQAEALLRDGSGGYPETMALTIVKRAQASTKNARPHALDARIASDAMQTEWDQKDLDPHLLRDAPVPNGDTMRVGVDPLVGSVFAVETDDSCTSNV